MCSNLCSVRGVKTASWPCVDPLAVSLKHRPPAQKFSSTLHLGGISSVYPWYLPIVLRHIETPTRLQSDVHEIVHRDQGSSVGVAILQLHQGRPWESYHGLPQNHPKWLMINGKQWKPLENWLEILDVTNCNGYSWGCMHAACPWLLHSSSHK